MFLRILMFSNVFSSILLLFHLFNFPLDSVVISPCMNFNGCLIYFLSHFLS